MKKIPLYDELNPIGFIEVTDVAAWEIAESGETLYLSFAISETGELVSARASRTGSAGEIADKEEIRYLMRADKNLDATRP